MNVGMGIKGFKSRLFQMHLIQTCIQDVLDPLVGTDSGSQVASRDCLQRFSAITFG